MEVAAAAAVLDAPSKGAVRDGPATRSVLLWVETGGDIAPVVTVRGLSCVDSMLDALLEPCEVGSNWSIAPRCEVGSSTGMLTELCAEEGRESSGMYLPGDMALETSGR